MLDPAGSTSLARALSESSASPRVKPGARLASIVAERIRLKWLSWRAPTPSFTCAMACKLDQAAVPSPQIDPGHVARGGALLRGQLRDDVVQFVVTGEGADLPPAEQRLQGAGHIAHRDAEVLGAVAIEVHRQLRLVDPEIGVHVGEPRNLPGPA